MRAYAIDAGVDIRGARIVQRGDAQVGVTAEVQVGERLLQVEGQGSGPIDAFVAGLNAAVGTSVRVLDYHEHAIGSGAAARAAAYLELRIGDTQTRFGVGIDADIVRASFKAIASALHRSQLDPQGAAAQHALA
ncbi:MAG TPA: alpha-isopropylmalate synthase regulatory domain-containing protein [Burkholderiaceae bacterium]|nr:alpha-isopropylmalate synthase regulatory domain-containing protein [Burkholderiaceae bacterium]